MDNILRIVTLCTIIAGIVADRIPLTDNDFVFKPNYGVTFEKELYLDTPTDFWYHNIVIPKPELQAYWNPKINSCEDLLKVDLNDTFWDDKVLENCADFEFLIKTYSNVRKEFQTMLNDQSQIINLLLKRGTGSHYHRESRTDAHFGTFGYYEQRVRRDCDCDEIISVVNRNTDQISDGFLRFTTLMNNHKGQFISVQETQTMRIRKVFKAVRELSSAMEVLENITSVHINQTFDGMTTMNLELKNLEVETNQRQGILAYLHWLNIKDIHLPNLMVTELEFFIKALSQLRKGYLPSYLVSVNDLTGILSSIRDVLNREYPNYNLLYEDVESYYFLNDIVSMHSSDHIFIRLRIPLQTVSVQFIVYKVKSYPLALHHKSSVRSKVIVSPMLAISVDGEYFLEPEATYLEGCTGSFHKMCPTFSFKKKISMATCTLALFTDDLINIRNLCRFDVLPPAAEIYSYVEYMGNSSVFVSTNDLKWYQNCNDNVTEIVGCNMCMIKQDCTCTLESESFFIPSSIESCNSNSSTSISLNILKHYMNLGAILQILDDENLRNLSISGNSFASYAFQKVPLDFINLESHLNAISKLDNFDKALNLDLRKTLERMKHENITEAVMGRLHLKHISWYAHNNHEIWISVLFVVFGIISTLILGYIGLKCCRCGRSEFTFLSTVLSGLAPTVKAWEDVEQALESTTVSLSTPKITEHPIYTILWGYPLYNITHLLQVLTFIVFIVFLTLLWKKCLRYYCTCIQENEMEAGCVIHVHVWKNVDKSYSFPLVRVPAPMKQVVVSDYGEDLEFKVIWVCCVIPFLSWNSDAIRVQLKHFGVHKLPSKVKIPLRLAVSLSRMLKAPNTIQLVLSDKKGNHPVLRRSGFVLNEPIDFPGNFGNLDDIDIEPPKFLGVYPNIKPSCPEV